MKYIRHTLPLILLLALSAPAAQAAESPNALTAADATGGYSGLVLNKISRLWSPPPDTVNRRVSVRLRIDGEGKLMQCDPMTPSDLPEMNKAACAAAKEADSFGPPPYGLDIDVFVTFWTGRPSKSALGAKDPVTTPAAPGPSQVIEKLQAEKAAKAAAPATEAPKATVPAKSDAPMKNAPAAKAPGATPKPDAKDSKDTKDTKGKEAKPKASKLDNPDAASVPIKNAPAKNAPATTQGKGETPKTQAKTESPKAPVKSEAPKPEGRKVEPAKTEKPKPEGRKVEPAKTETPKPEGRKVEPAKSEAPKPEGRKVEPAKTEPAKAEAPKAEAPKAEPAKPKAATVATAPVTAAPPIAPTAPAGQQQAKVAPGTPMSRYMDDIIFMVRPRIIPPARIPSGKYTVGIVLSVDNRGQVTGTKLDRSSGQTAMDDAVLLAVTKVGKLSAPPDKQPHNLNLTFSVQKP